jgi:tRNA uridine 5-carboxymethylaminomethyl modification enzyme
MFNGAIQSTGPRYCPSIEDKIHRFADRNRHQIFVEPEGWNTVEIYVNGFSTSLPEDVQLEALRKMKGFEKARIFRPGYAIEYDYFPPIQLSHSLQTKLIENLFFAGQINGTTGYEEAGAQGLMAGINAHLKVHGGSPFVLKRSDAYIGVLIDDLITKGTEEPYRMFTSRAEYRILLRQDNADIRLTRLSHDIGLASKEAVARVEEKERQMALASEFVATHNFTPEDINPVLESQKSAPISVKKRINEVLARPQIQIHNLLTLEPLSSFQQAEKISADAWVQTEIHHKYKGYIERERENADKLTRLEDVRIPNELDYHSLQSLSAESREKLARIRPVNIGQAKRISGVSPSDIQVLLVYLGR